MMPRILVVEDSPTQARQLAFTLEDAGFEVEIAPDAEAGLTRLANGGDPIDAILSDLNLPGNSGFDLCRRLKADPALRGIPIVVCTGEVDPLNVLKGLEAGADGFVTKRREPPEIVAAVGRALAHPTAAVDAPPLKVECLGREFVLSADRQRLVDILVTAFEDVVHLNERWIEAARSERRAHEERKRAEAQLVQAEKLSALGRTAAGVAHEINNPLAFVINNVALIARDLAGLRDLIALYGRADALIAEQQPELAEAIRELAGDLDPAEALSSLEALAVRSGEGLRRIQKIIGDLRDFARLDEYGPKEADLNQGIRSTLALVRGEAQRRRVTLDEDLSPLPPLICHPARINQVVHSLLLNAIEACAPGGRVTITSRSTPGAVGFEILDDGPGIDPAILDKVFEPFFTTKPVGQGTGLGLAISYAIVRDHGGCINLESTLGHGTRAVVRLPLEVPAHIHPQG